MDLGSVVIVDGDDELPNFVLPRVDVVEGYLLWGHSWLCVRKTIDFNKYRIIISKTTYFTLSSELLKCS